MEIKSKNVINVIENELGRLTEVRQIGKESAAQIIKAGKNTRNWKMSFGLPINTIFCLKILNMCITYTGKTPSKKLKKNPTN